MKNKSNKSNKSNKLKSKVKYTKKNKYNKQGGTKNVNSVVSRSRIKSSYKRPSTIRKTSKKQLRFVTNDTVEKLVDLCENKNWEEYDKVSQDIMKEYWKTYRMSSNTNATTIDFFEYLNNNYNELPLNKKLCLERSMIHLQEDAIPESMSYLSDIFRLKRMNQ